MFRRVCFLSLIIVSSGGLAVSGGATTGGGVRYFTDHDSAADNRRRVLKVTGVSFAARFCGKGEAKLIFGANVGGCLIYDSKKGRRAFIRICGGLMSTLAGGELGVGGVSVGGSVDFKGVGCLIIHLDSDLSGVEIMKRITGPGEESRRIRKEVLGSVKSYLLELDEESLNELGISRGRIGDWKDLKFNVPIREEKSPTRKEKIKKAIKRLKTPRRKPSA